MKPANGPAFYRDNEVSAPSQGWANYATVMGYYLHRLKNGRSLRRSAQRTLVTVDLTGVRTDIVVRWRTISLHGTVLGTGRTPRIASV
jgi:hypothetical protein